MVVRWCYEKKAKYPKLLYLNLWLFCTFIVFCLDNLVVTWSCSFFCVLGRVKSMKLRLPKLKLLLQKHRIAQLGISFLQKKGTFRAYFVTFALLKVCQIFSNVSLHTYYVEVNLLTLPHKLRYSLDFYCQVNFVYLRFFSPGWTLLKLLKKHSCLNVLLLLFK